MSRPVLDGDRMLADLAALAEFGRSAGGGVDRVAYGPADRAARAWVIEQLRGLGVEAAADPAGNTVGRYPGREPLAPLAIGSHTDSVPDGGAFDGALGVVAALACLRALRDAGLRLRHPVEL